MALDIDHDVEQVMAKINNALLRLDDIDRQADELPVRAFVASRLGPQGSPAPEWRVRAVNYWRNTLEDFGLCVVCTFGAATMGLVLLVAFDCINPADLVRLLGN